MSMTAPINVVRDEQVEVGQEMKAMAGAKGMAEAEVQVLGAKLQTMP